MKIRMVVVLLVILFTAGIAAAQNATPLEIDAKFPAAKQWLNQNNLSITKSPEQALLLVAEEGIPSLKARTMAQKNVQAERAATYMANRQLAKMIEKLIVASGKNEGFVDETVKEAVKEAKVVYKDYNEQEEEVLVLVKIELFRIRGLSR